MGKSVYQLWISQGKDKLRFPVLPSELEITNNVQNETVKVASFGELTFIDVPSAKQVSFTSLFPKKYSPIAEYKSIPSPENAIAKIERMMRSKKSVRLIVTGTKINMTCSIESFTHKEGSYDIGDREFTIELKEYKTASPRKIKRKKKQNKRKRNGLQKHHQKCTPSKRGYTMGHFWQVLWRQYKMAAYLECQ